MDFRWTDIPDPRNPTKALRMQKTAPKGLDVAGAVDWAKKNADKFLAEALGDKKETPTQTAPTIPKPSVSGPARVPTLAAVYADMSAIIESQEPGTQVTWASIWRCHLAPTWGKRPVDLIDRLGIIRWRTELLKKQYAPSTCNEIVTKLQGILSHAADQGHITGRPKIQKLPTQDAAEKDAYSEEELERFHDAAKGDEVATLVLILTLDTGLRRNELIALRWLDIDFGGEKVRVRHSMYQGKLKCVKGKKAVDIPMTPRLKEALVAAKGSRKMTDHVFRGIQQPWASESALRNHMIEVAARANVEWKGFHKGKHTFISTLMDEGAPLQELQLLARHKHPTTTEGYMHTRESAKVMRSGIARLGRAQAQRDPGVKNVLSVVK